VLISNVPTLRLIVLTEGVLPCSPRLTQIAFFLHELPTDSRELLHSLFVAANSCTEKRGMSNL
jgi:hypothetical protein